ncbi:MAG: alpha/beta fold hydrolase [Leucobacter sp.]
MSESMTNVAVSTVALPTGTEGTRQVRLHSRGSGPRVVLFLHPGAPGRPPFAGSSDLFASTLAGVDLEGYRLLAPDLPGAGGTDLFGLDELRVDGTIAFVGQLLEAVGPVDELHVIAQGAPGLAALKMAREGVAGIAVTSLMLIGANTAAPTGDSIQNVSLLNPPRPWWDHRFHNWAVRRLAYVPALVPEAIIDTMVGNASGAPHRAAEAATADPLAISTLVGDELREQDHLYAYCRNEGYTVPISLVWGAGDPTVSVARGSVLAEILSSGTGHLDFNLINQAAHLVQFDRAFQFERAVEQLVRRNSASAS